MISSKDLVINANEVIDKIELTELEIAQLAGIDPSLENAKTVVPNVASLPPAAENKGRMIYVTDIEEYYFSDGIDWLDNFSTVYDTSSAISEIAYAWGYNNAGRLGDDTLVDKSSPATVVGYITNWSQVSAGRFHNLGLISDGIAYTWGENGFGMLGDGTTVDKSSPVTVVGGITNWTQVSAGGSHSLGITDTGVAYAWGANGGFSGSGMLGDNTTVNKSSPVTVVGGLTWSQVSAGEAHSLGISGGIAYAWGSNSRTFFGSGMLGDGTTVDKSSPVTVVGGITNWTQLSASRVHSLGIAGGVAYAWGEGSSGRLGDNSTVDKSSPVTVVGGITNWSQVSAGEFHNLGLTSDGIAYTWGDNGSGMLGDGTTVDKSSPVTVVGGITNWSQVSAGFNHSLGVTDTGIGYAWGFNSFGRLGDGTTVNKSSPATVVGGITSWTQLSGGGSHSLGTRTNFKGFNTL